MLAKARRNLTSSGLQNVQFIHAPITSIKPLQSSSADCIISNCVINLLPGGEKQRVFDEMARLLKPGGRAATSDILLKRELPEDQRSNIALYVGCIAGASKVPQYEEYLARAGFRGEQGNNRMLLG
jgi:arsenite methyltransferase